jgi:hypothetical protein
MAKPMLTPRSPSKKVALICLTVLMALVVLDLLRRVYVSRVSADDGRLKAVYFLVTQSPN